ncbi:serine protease [Cupriavidus pauculus]|uniref:serine protease n=1 Tax=Cupriavidus pauculus TaxID=82633 RepID=UPI003CC80B01
MNRYLRVLAATCLLASLPALAQVEPLGTKGYGTQVFKGYDADKATASYTAAIFREGMGFPEGFICGSTVIANGWLLTAAHCLYDRDCRRRDASTLYSVANMAVFGPEPRKISVKTATPHPAFQCTTVIKQLEAIKAGKPLPMGNDIALIRAPGVEVPGSGLYLPGGTLPLPPSPLVASGWGSLGNNTGMSAKLQSVKLSTQPHDTCAKAWLPSTISPDQLCVGPPSSRADGGICSGDSGGPLVGASKDYFVQVGVVSLGHLVCNIVDRPSLFTDVESHRKWIEGVVGAGNLPTPAGCTLTAYANGIC